jgi:hypothetical protein
VTSQAKSVSVVALGALGFFGFVAGEVSADTILITPAAPVTSGGTTTYSYELALAPYTALYTDATPATTDQWSPDFLDIIDFYGYVDGSLNFTSAIPGVTFALATPYTDPAIAGGLTVGGPLPPDDQNVVNLRAEFMGGSFINNTSDRVVLGTLEAKSIYANPIVGKFIATATAPDGSSSITNDGQILTPDPPAEGAPLPMAVWGGLGLMSVLGLSKARRRVL